MGSVFLSNSGDGANNRAFVTVVTLDNTQWELPQWEVLGNLKDGSVVSYDLSNTVGFQDQWIHTITFAQPLADFESFHLRRREHQTLPFEKIQVPPLSQETASEASVPNPDELPETVHEIIEKLNETFRSKDYERTVRLCTKAIEGHSGVESYFSIRANAHNALGNFKKALADYTEALRLSPWNISFLVARSMTYYLMADFDKALDDSNIAVEVSPQGRTFCVRGRVHHAKGDYQAALAYFEKAVQTTPGYSRTFLDIAWLLATCPDDTIRNGEKASGYAGLAEAVLSDSDSETVRADLAVMRAAVYAEQKDYKLAIWLEGAYLKSVPIESQEALQSNERLKVYQAHKPFRSPLPMHVNPWR